MADIRIKDLATTASSAASDDFMALDGATNGTRKMSAANPSVTTLTTSGVITPGGSVHGANGAVGNPSFAFASDQNTGLYRIGLNNIGVAANGNKVLDIATTGLTVTGALGASSLTSPASTNLTLTSGLVGTNKVNFPDTLSASSATVGAVTIGNGTAATNVAIGGGKINIGDTTAGSSGAGALVVTGGLSAGNNGNASYFGGAATFAGAVTVAGGSNTTSAGAVNLTSASYGGGYTLKDGTKYLGIFAKTSGTQLCFYTNQAAGTDLGSVTPDLIINTGTSTFAGAVTVGGALKLGNPYVGTVIVPTGYVTIQDSNGNTYKIAVSA